MNAELLVDGRELKDALKTIRLSDRKLSCGEVAFSFTDGWLELQTQGVSVQIVASGTWPGRARASLSGLRPLLLQPPQGNQVVIRFSDDRLAIGSYSVRAQWEDISPPPTIVAMDLSWIELLKLRFEYSEATLISGGMGPKIARAEKELEANIAHAAVHLCETGVTEQDLLELVYRKLAESKKD